MRIFFFTLYQFRNDADMLCGKRVYERVKQKKKSFVSKSLLSILVLFLSVEPATVPDTLIFLNLND